MAIYRDKQGNRYREAKKEAKDQRQPGQVSATLRRRMGDALADIFDDYGPEVYSETVLALKDVILERFKEGFEALDGTVKDELGRRGIEESRQHIRAWSNEIVEDVNHMGLDEVAGALEDYVGTLTAEYQQPEGEEGDELLEVADEDLEEVDVEEVAEEDVEPEEGEESDEEPEEISFEELGIEMPTDEMAASFGPLGGRRKRAPSRRFRREARRPVGSRERTAIPVPLPGLSTAINAFDVEGFFNADGYPNHDKYREQIDQWYSGPGQSFGSTYGVEKLVDDATPDEVDAADEALYHLNKAADDIQFERMGETEYQEGMRVSFDIANLGDGWYLTVSFSGLDI